MATLARDMPILEQDRMAREDFDSRIHSAADRLVGSAETETPQLTERDATDAAHAVLQQMTSLERKATHRLRDTVIGALVMGHAFALLFLYYVLWRPASVLGSFAFTIFLASTCGGLLFLSTGRTVESIAPEPPLERQEKHKLRDRRGWLMQTIARRLIKLALSSALAPFAGYLFAAKVVMRVFPFVMRFIRGSEVLSTRLRPLWNEFTVRFEQVRLRIAQLFEQLKARLRARKAQATRTAKVAKENVKEAANDATIVAARKADSIKLNAKAAKANVKDAANDATFVAARKADDAMLNARAAKETAKEGINDFVDVAADKAADAKMTMNAAANDIADTNAAAKTDIRVSAASRREKPKAASEILAEDERFVDGLRG